MTASYTAAKIAEHTLIHSNILRSIEFYDRTNEPGVSRSLQSCVFTIQSVGITDDKFLI